MKITKVEAPNLRVAWKRARRNAWPGHVATGVKHKVKLKYRGGSVYSVRTRKRKQKVWRD